MSCSWSILIRCIFKHCPEEWGYPQKIQANQLMPLRVGFTIEKGSLQRPSTCLLSLLTHHRVFFCCCFLLFFFFKPLSCSSAPHHLFLAHPSTLFLHEQLGQQLGISPSDDTLREGWVFCRADVFAGIPQCSLINDFHRKTERSNTARFVISPLPAKHGEERRKIEEGRGEHRQGKKKRK